MKQVTVLSPDGSTFIEHVDVVTALHRRFLGLMGRRSLRPQCGFYFPRCRCIHTFGMRFPLDVIFVTRTCRVTRVARALPPGRVARGSRETYGVIEIESGWILALPRRGDQLAMAPSEA